MHNKLLCVDLDGTLTSSSTWEGFNMTLGISPDEDIRLFHEYKKGNLAYKDWIAQLIAHYKNNDPVSVDTIKSFAQSVSFRDGAEELVTQAKEKGYTTLLLSGSVDVIVKEIAEKLGFDAWRSTNTLVLNNNEEIVDILAMGDEGQAKVSLLEQFCHQKGFDLKETISIGDGGNDKEIFLVTKGIALGNNSDLGAIAWKKVETLSEIEGLI